MLGLWQTECTPNIVALGEEFHHAEDPRWHTEKVLYVWRFYHSRWSKETGRERTGGPPRELYRLSVQDGGRVCCKWFSNVP